jgi:hypothetical protein
MFAAAVAPTRPPIRLGHCEPNSIAPAIFMAVDRGCMMRPQLVVGLRCRAEIRPTDGFATVRVTFGESEIIVEDAPPGDPSLDPPGGPVSVEEVVTATEAPSTPWPPAIDPMLDTGVRMAQFVPDVSIEGKITDMLALVTTPMVAGLPDLTDPRGRATLVRLMSGRVKFRGSPFRARELTNILRL